MSQTATQRTDGGAGVVRYALDAEEAMVWSVDPTDGFGADPGLVQVDVSAVLLEEHLQDWYELACGAVRDRDPDECLRRFMAVIPWWATARVVENA
jgi:hypothetical protein